MTPPRAADVLAPCPDSPNCVSSLATDPRHAIAPLAAAAPPEAVRAALRHAVEGLPRTRVVLDEPLRLSVECRSLIFRFVDDLDLVIDPEAGVVHVRSASRLGYSDLGVNRRRVEALRSLLAEELAGRR